MMMKMKNRSYGHEKNSTRSRRRVWKPIYFIFCSFVNLKLFLRESWKNQFFSFRFVVSEIAIWRLIFLTNFYKRVYILFKKRHASDCQKKISFVQIIHLKFTFLTLDDIGISKLVSQLKLLSSLFEFKDMIWAPLLKNCKIKKKYLKNKRYAL